MFGTLGGPELFLILVVALIVFGPKKLPEIGKSIGRMMNEFKKASNEFRQTLEDEVEADKRRETARIEPPVTVPASVVEEASATVPTEPASAAPAEPLPPVEPVVSRDPALAADSSPEPAAPAIEPK
jgi:TatA/E family protein of Tat protein translocase